MTSEDLKLVAIFGLTCATWYLVGFFSGLMVTCGTALEEGYEEGIAAASSPTSQ